MLLLSCRSLKWTTLHVVVPAGCDKKPAVQNENKHKIKDRKKQNRKNDALMRDCRPSICNLSSLRLTHSLGDA